MVWDKILKIITRFNNELSIDIDMLLFHAA